MSNSEAERLRQEIIDLNRDHIYKAIVNMTAREDELNNTEQEETFNALKKTVHETINKRRKAGEKDNIKNGGEVKYSDFTGDENRLIVESINGSFKKLKKKYPRSRVIDSKRIYFRLIDDMVVQKYYGDIRINISARRRAIYDQRKILSVGMDNGLKIIEALRYLVPIDLKNKEAIITSFLSELLLLGIPLEWALKLKPSDFFPEQNRIVIRTDAKYDFVMADDIFWARYSGYCEKLFVWFWSIRNINPQSLEMHISRERALKNLNNLIKSAVSIAEIKNNAGASYLNLVEWGKAYRICLCDVNPSYYGPITFKTWHPTVESISAMQGKEYQEYEIEKEKNENSYKRSSQVSEPEHLGFLDITLDKCRGLIFQDYSQRGILDKKAQKSENEVKTAELEALWIEMAAEKISSDLRILSALVSEGEEAGIKLLREQMKKYWHIDKSELSKNIAVELGNNNDLKNRASKLIDERGSCALHLIEWLINQLKTGLARNSIKNYFTTLARVFRLCEIMMININDMTEEETYCVMTGCLSGDMEEAGDNTIGQSMFNKFKYLLTSYRAYIASKGIECSELNIYELVKYVKKAVRIVFIPKEELFIKKLDSLIRNGRNIEAAIGILGAYLGMRREEIISLKKQNIKIFKNDIKGSYVYFLGKGSKWRQVSLQFIPNIRHIKFLINMVLTDDGSGTLLKLKNEEAFESIFSGSDSWGKLFPCGSHDMRRSFTTWNHMRGVPILKIALALGHEELKNMDHYNQDRFRDYNSILLGDINMLPEWIPEGHAARLAITTKRTLKDTVMLELMKRRVLNAKRKKRGKVVFYDARFLVSTLKDLLKARYKERQEDINYEGFYNNDGKREKNKVLDVPGVGKQPRKLRLNVNMVK